jgi:GNAT superfamily N-acetyltransferase
VENARRATTDDVHIAAVLWDQAVAELEGQRGGALLAGSLTRPDLPATLAAALSDPDRLLVVGLIDDVTIGLASVFCERGRPEPVGNLELIYVDPLARQVGVAEAMLGLVRSWCSERGCRGVDAPALPGNRQAKAFFEGEGFLARLLVMHYPLDGLAQEGAGD